MLKQEIELYPNREHGEARFYAVQGESGGRELRLNLYDAQGQSVDVSQARAFLYVMKPDRNAAVINCQTGTNGKKNQVSCRLTLQAAACAGICSLLLQVLTESEDLRYDNMQLYVTPDSIDRLASLTEFSELTRLLQSAGSIEALLNQAEYTAEHTASVVSGVLGRYAGELEKTASGLLPPPAGSDSVSFSPAVNGSGDMLLVSDDWGKGSKWSRDGGITWQDTAPYDSGTVQISNDLVLGGGDSFLLADQSHLVWGRVLNEELTWNTPSAHSFPIRGGVFVNGSFVAFQDGAEYTASPTGRPMLFFSPGSNTPRTVALPNPRMIATALAHDPATGLYIAGGRYASALPEDSLNGMGWLATTKDLNAWSVIRERDTDAPYDKILVHRGLAVLLPVSASRTRLLVCPVSDLAKNSFTTVALDTWCGDGFADDFGISFLGSGTLYHSEDGKKYTAQVVDGTWGQSSRIAGGNRRLLLVCENEYAVYRMDLIGENLLDSLEQLEQDYVEKVGAAQTVLETTQTEVDAWREEITAQLTEAAGYKIAMSSTDPGTGSPLETGKLLFVYEEG